MSSQRSRAPRNGQRGVSTDTGFNVQEIWGQVLEHLKDIDRGEVKAAVNREKIFEGEQTLAAKKAAGKGITVSETDDHSALFREGVRLSEQQVGKLRDGSLIAKLELLRDLMKNKEKEAIAAAEVLAPSRASASRVSNMDFDGTGDSPGPSPAENRQVRKIGTSRMSSQPPKGSADETKSATSETNERVSKPKIVYAVDEKVAFKRKQQGKTDEQEWILGEVVRVIGEGKSRRYEVLDPYPDPGGPKLYKSSASQMVPIPLEGTPLEDYEVGKRVLALYPDTSAFYRAEVKGTLDGGAKVQLLFEDEVGGELRIVERRLALDHKG